MRIFIGSESADPGTGIDLAATLLETLYDVRTFEIEIVLFADILAQVVELTSGLARSGFEFLGQRIAAGAKEGNPFPVALAIPELASRGQCQSGADGLGFRGLAKQNAGEVVAVDG